MFIELFLLKHLRCFFVTDDWQRRVFLSGTPSMTVMHSGRRPHFARVHVDLRRQGFFSLAARLARDGRLWVDTTWMRELSELVVEDNHTFSNRSLWRRTPGRLVCRAKRSKGHPSAPVQQSASFHFCCGHWYHYWRTFSFFSCLKVKAPLREAQFWARVDRSSRSRTCPPWLVTAPRITMYAHTLVCQSSFFLINSSLSAPTKIEELTAGSDEKNTAQPPAGNRTQDLANSSRTL